MSRQASGSATLAVAGTPAHDAHDALPIAAGAYGDRNAAIYDQIYPRVETGLLDQLESLAGKGPALELGVGTGRVALPLAQRGVPVVGVDASTAMLARLHERRRSEPVRTVLANFVDADLGGPYSLIYALVSTLNLLPDLGTFARCLSHARRFLKPDGALLIESYLSSEPSGHRQQSQVPIATRHGQAYYQVQALAIDLIDQDRFACAAGLVLHERWCNWAAAPWHADAPPFARHISIYRLGSTSER
ncbi:hypothetical protein C7S18_04250 [Ahniella affigens]|uniref:Methyltransferase domain-containing protein n=1 Tax=Ahniella affigens TaxID=2021234 RepID=A0A2P1PNN5_9GAMM|nr:class I SAM-dependent methyltransferase [Ahniella affigens]AVP96453.1 hypothetical protein C7S18_04250 [Ahniella affigens]